MLTASIFSILCVLAAHCAGAAVDSDQDELRRVVRSEETRLSNFLRPGPYPQYRQPSFLRGPQQFAGPMFNGPMPAPGPFMSGYLPQPQYPYASQPAPYFPPSQSLPPPPPASLMPQPPSKTFHHIPNMQNGGNSGGNGGPVLDFETGNDDSSNANVGALFDGEHCGLSKPGLVNLVAGGIPVDSHEHPWYVQIIIHNDQFMDATTYCGGTLITKEWVLTAAHCYDDMRTELRASNTHVSFQGLHGTKKKVTGRVDQVVIHPSYIPATLTWDQRRRGVKPGPYNDMALLRIRVRELPDALYKRLVPACLPAKGFRVQTNTQCKVMGHGFTDADGEKSFRMPSELLAANVRLTTNQACRDDVESEVIRAKINDEHTTCLRGPIQPCVGDSGGPLLCSGSAPDAIDGSDFDANGAGDDGTRPRGPRRWFLYGVVSFAVSTDDHDTCGTFKSVVFGVTSTQYDWIKSTVVSNTIGKK